jgi:hypothetical protein
MNIVDHVYDIAPKHLLMIALAIAAAANLAFVFFGGAGWAVVALVWLLVVVLSAIAHRWNARWLLATAPVSFILPVLLAVFMHYCMAANSCP